ncbi:MAG: hypothetical protein MUQ56_08800 [Thermoleophilia bacterium]|nr:hypothetical protein [Thermoleophilia bacterium]
MGKPWKKKQKIKLKSHHGPCFVKGCKHNGSLMHHCKICEALVAEGEIEKSFEVQFCGYHVVEAGKKMKRHILTKHPVTIPALFWAKLKGEDA